MSVSLIEKLGEGYRVLVGGGLLVGILAAFVTPKWGMALSVLSVLSGGIVVINGWSSIAQQRSEIMAGLRADLDGNPFGYLAASFLNIRIGAAFPVMFAGFAVFAVAGYLYRQARKIELELEPR